MKSKIYLILFFLFFLYTTHFSMQESVINDDASFSDSSTSPFEFVEPSYAEYQAEIRARIKEHRNLNTPYPGDQVPILYKLIEHGYVKLLKKLLINGAKTEVSFNNQTLLNFAISIDTIYSPAIIHVLLKHGACANGENNLEQEPLELACLVENSHRIFQYAKHLCLYGANPNGSTTHFSPLSTLCDRYAIEFSEKPRDRKHISNTIKLLIMHGADLSHINISMNKKAIEFFLDKKAQDLAEILKITEKKCNNLIQAVKEKRMIDFLHMSFPICHIKDTAGNNLMYYALQNENWDMSEKLFYLKPALLIQENFAGKTPLHSVIENQNTITWLFKHFKNKKKNNVKRHAYTMHDLRKKRRKTTKNINRQEKQ